MSIFKWGSGWFLILLFFIFSGSWYGPAELIISGSATTQDSFNLSWDSGAGYNSYENELFAFSQAASAPDEKLTVSIQYLDKRNSASLSNEVVVENIVIDTVEQKLTDFRLNKGSPVLELQVLAKSHVQVELLSNNHSGIAGVQVGSEYTERDLYVANVEARSKVFNSWLLGDKGQFSIRLKVPRYQIDEFKISLSDHSGTLTIDTVIFSEGFHKFPLEVQRRGQKNYFSLEGIRNLHYWSPVPFGFQLVFSILTLWIINGLARQVQHCGGIRSVFSGRRKIFWLLALGAAGAFSLWLIPFWPGVMSVDSLKIWRAALLPEVFVNDHPLFNVVFYMYLSHLWKNPAVVPIVQILLLSILIAYIYFSIYRQGIPLKFLLPFYFLLLGSIPVGLYNLVLWKDIPFAMLVVFWAALIVFLNQDKKDGRLQIKGEQWVILLILLLALSLARHNGVIYLFLIPFLFICLRIIPAKVVYLTFSLSSVFVLCFILFNNHIEILDSGYLFDRGVYFFKNFINEPFSSRLASTWKMYWGIWDINQTKSKWDLWHYYLGDRYAYGFLKHAGWDDIYPYMIPSDGALPYLRKIALDLYSFSYKYPAVFFTWNPVYMLGVYLLSILLLFRFPRTALYSLVILSQVFCLLFFIKILNWRYYYFAYLGSYFLVPMLLLDIYSRRENR